MGPLIRSWTSADLDDYARMKSAAESVAPHVSLGSVEAVKEALNVPHEVAGRCIFIAEMDSAPAGFLEAKIEPFLQRMRLDCWIEPSFRGNRLAAGLFNHALRRIKNPGIRLAHACAAEDNESARIYLSRTGFSPARRFLELAADITLMQPDALERAAAMCRALKPGEEGKLAHVQNAAFAGSWGFSPNTAQDIKQSTSLSISTRGDVLIAERNGSLAAYCWTGVVWRGKVRTGKVFMLGVDPAEKGRGLGKLALLAGLKHLRDKGVSRVELTVDAENDVAKSLYFSLGFKQSATSLMYEKLLAD